MTTYRIPTGVRVSYLDNRPFLSTPQGGKVAIDTTLLSIWQKADGRKASEILPIFRQEGATQEAIYAALACLVEAGLLVREQDKSQSLLFQTVSAGLVSVVIVNYNSWEWVKECLPSLSLQTYTPLEVIVVDNGSTENLPDWLKVNYPTVKFSCLEKSESLAHAINYGVALSQGNYFLVLNPDVTLEPDAVAQMVAVAQSDSNCAAVAAKLKFWWAPAFLNGLGNRVEAFSWGTDNAIGHLDLGQFDDWREVPSACFAATLIPCSAWDAVGSVDEAFPLYYEDSEWSYRARLLGYTVRAAPQAVVYHAFGSKVPSGEDNGLTARKLRRVVHGRLRFAGKILEIPYLRKFFRNYIVEDWVNFSRSLYQRQWSTALAYLAGWWDFCQNLPMLLPERRRLQARRSRGDDELFALQDGMPPGLVWQGLPELTWDSILYHYLPLLRSHQTRPMPEFEDSQRRPHLLIVSNDVVNTKMAGPGMRYLEMARALSSDMDVTLAVPSDTELDVPNVRLVRYWLERPGSLHLLVENSDVALVSGYMIEQFPFLQLTQTRIVVDLYDPFILENFHYHLNEPIAVQESFNQKAVDITNSLARLGDFFICGSDRQRDFWMGTLASNGRINPHTFAQDPTLRSLIDVVGIGFPHQEPRSTPMLRGIHPAFPEDAQIVLWWGGIWDWLDPLTLVKAWTQVLAKHPQARLVFVGTRHPNPLVPRHKIVDQTLALATEIGEKERTIFFYEWLPYDQREALLCEADIGVTLHPPYVETRYSIRTRILDYLWARLPVLVSEGDVTSEWISQYGVGQVVPPLDVEALTQALTEMLDKPKSSWASAYEPFRDSFRWSQVVEPLRRYCWQGEQAPDRHLRNLSVTLPTVALRRGKVARAIEIWRTDGLPVLLFRLRQKLQQKLVRL
jgi:GT2 family glycosyltransferase/glycosyltransferase involved in cell wall biosynthesis